MARPPKFDYDSDDFYDEILALSMQGLTDAEIIDKIKGFDNIFVTEHSYNLIHEGRNYVWAKDKDGNYINEPEDHDNHCFDAIRYYINGKILGKIIKPKNVNKSDLGIF